MLKNILLLMIIIFLLIVNNSSAQGCCTVGSSSFGGLERGITSKGTIKLGLGYLTNNLNTTYNGNNSIPDPLDRTALVTVYNFELEFGITENISILFISGYTFKKRETAIFAVNNISIEKVSFKENGVTDVTLLAKYELLNPTIISPFGITIGGGVKLPVGMNNKKDNGTRLPIDLQPGTGSVDVLFWGNIYKGFPSLDFSIASSFFYKYAGSNLDGYKFGDEYVLSIMGEYYLVDYLTLSLNLKSRFSRQDFSSGRFLPSTGGSYLDVMPGIIYYEGSTQIKVFYQLPLYRNVRGIQLTTSNAMGIEVLINLN